MKQTSGFEQLLEALKQSGADMGDMPFGGPRGTAGGGRDGAGNAGGAGAGAGAGAAGRGGSGAGGNGGNPVPHIEVPFADRMADWGKKALIALAVVVIVAALAAYWWFHPPINIHSVDTWTFIAVFILLPAFLVCWSKSKKYAKTEGKVEASPRKAKTFKLLSLIPVAVLVVGVLGAVMSLSIFPGNAHKYATVLETEHLDFAQDIKEVDYAEIPVIDRDSAVLLGNREMGSIPEYVSQFEISPLYSQINYQGEPVRVSPLGYADLFKWFTNREGGIPAYVLVNMTTQDAEIVRLEGSPIHYSQSEPLVRNIDRHVQLKYPFYMFDEKSFEIDEEGHPWWICPVQTRTIGLFGGTTINRVVLCDATTGECQDLAVEDCPEWVDRVYPAELLIQQYNWSGAYSNGWLNSVLGQQGVVQTTPGTDGTQGYNYIAKDDDVWVYTGVTSATADNSIVGFVLVNQRTQDSHFYSIAGATEESAMQSAEGQVQNLRYTAMFPLLINVANQPTYFMALKDSAGLVKKFAMIDIQRYQNVAIGDTVADCQKAYVQLLATNGVDLSSAVEALDSLEASGTIARMAQAVIDGNSHFYVTLDGDGNIYDFSLPAMVGIVGYQVGDTISFSYIDNEGSFTVDKITDPDAPAVSATSTSKEQEAGAEDSAEGSSEGESQAGGTGVEGAAQTSA